MQLNEANKDFQSLDTAVAFRIQRLARLLRNHLAQFLSDNDFEGGPEQWAIVFRLWELGTAAQKDLVDDVLNDRANITRHIQALERKGYVSRVSSADDGRKKIVALTEKGKTKFNQLKPLVIAERQRIFTRFGDSEFKQLLSGLSKVEASLS